MKNYCETHHLYYNSAICPFCQNEKNEKLLKANTVKTKKAKTETEKKTDDTITDDVLEKLKNHFKK